MIMIMLILSVVVIVADFIFKQLAVAYLKDGEVYTFLGGLVRLEYVENRGMAFGMLQNFRWFFIIFTLAIIFGAVIYVIKTKPKSVFFKIALSLIIGGGIGNLIDRIIMGYVVDYIQLSFFNPVCNFADYCITIGTALLLIYIVFFTQDETKQKE
ncbi:MAG: signal peptidase II [Clostridia bacterium]|nr:signal peptidase II [Clostridia bacterium]